MQYVELHCASNFSFLRGASHPEELIERALALEYTGLALTDECSFAGSVRAHLALTELREEDTAARAFKLIHGTEIRLSDGPKLVLLAQTRTGYGNLSQLVTLARRQATKGSYTLTRKDVETHAPWLQDALALLIPSNRKSGSGTNCEPPLQSARKSEKSVPDPDFVDLVHARWLHDLMPGRAWIACELLRTADDAATLARLTALSQASGLPLVAAGDVHMHARSRKPLQDVLTAVRHKTPLAQAGTRLLPNAERYLRPRYRLERIYPPELLAETLAIAERCNFSLDELRYEYPEEIVPPGETPATWLRKATYEEAQRRYPQGMPDKVRRTVEHELALIGDLQYEPYFLTVYDIVRFARSQNILCQGRGSAANSAVCYCLGITEVDPARMSVLFERFISKERNEPPDIDVDFEHQRREEVMQYIYAKYGRHRAALTAALHTYRPRGALRDVGKALGLSLDQVDKLARTMAWWDGRRIKPERLIEAGFDPDNPVIAQVVGLAQQLVGFPRHLSQHSGGFVIARERLDRLVPIENAAMADRTVIQWDKDDLDALGLLKIDVLALGMLSCVRRALDHVNRFYADPIAQVLSHAPKGATVPQPLPGAPRKVEMHHLPAECSRVYDMLCKGDSLGVFQVESRAQMNMLPRLRPRTFYDLVIETAIVRPGPIQGGMVHPYLKRRQGLEPVTYPSDAVRGVLERTLGVSIFQEQVMQLAVVAAGFTPGEADKLRRAMAAWKRKGGIGPFRDKLITGMLARGYTHEYAEQIYRQIQGFGEYGFPESHAASFALLVYVSSWLKCHEPAAFCAALLDSQPLGFYAPAQIVRDALNHGVEIRPIEVTASAWHCTLEPSSKDPQRPALRLGLQLVNGFNEDAGLRIEAARRDRPFDSVADLTLRARLNRQEINSLAAADALAPLTGHRRHALWATLGLDPDAPRSAPLTAAAPAREAKVDLLAPTEGQDIVADYEHTALTLRRHPLALLRSRFDAMRLCTAADVFAARPRQRVRTTGIVTCRQRPGTASGVTFVTLEDETGVINVVVWSSVAEKYRRELLGSTLLTVYGHVERIEAKDTPVVHLIAQRLVDHSGLLGGLEVGSRDFH
ncbi:MAG: error-prone DNA polymerase [Burkholderiaceae bacterium]|nr:error-prone DNA polymerase [Burkholderiaceae bacterium]